MFAVRIYIVVLTLAFLVATAMTSGIGVLSATVIVCPLLYLILDIREELQDLRLLEARIASLAHQSTSLVGE
ncbi:MAG TPA: hypothetical protein VE977_10625 [Pyrinomonadaceae bacterium]|nr:hypothetical protein [Pyrinomonadaceae bacterium]